MTEKIHKGKTVSIRPANVFPKRVLWDGTRIIDPAEEKKFVDSECFEGKYHPNTADVVFLEPELLSVDAVSKKKRKTPKVTSEL
jgi:hypothetical protein